MVTGNVCPCGWRQGIDGDLLFTEDGLCCPFCKTRYRYFDSLEPICFCGEVLSNHTQTTGHDFKKGVLIPL